MIINVPKHIRTFVWSFLQDNNVGKRNKANGSKIEQYVGLLGECTVKWYLGIDYKLKDEFDNGVDFNYKSKKFDVKTMGRKVYPKPNYVNNFIAYQKDFNCDAYIFCSLNKTNYDLTICGWATKEQLLERGVLYKQGTIRKRTDETTFKLKAPTYEIKNTALNNINTLWD